MSSGVLRACLVFSAITGPVVFAANLTVQIVPSAVEVNPPFDRERIIHVQPLAHVRGTFKGGVTEHPKTLVAVAYRSPTDEERPATGDDGTPLECHLEGAHWQCDVPAEVALDLRVTADRFAPLFYWHVAARPGQTVSLEPRALQEGGSVAGWIEGPRGNPIDGAKVLLTPATVASDEHARVASREIAAKTNAHGFFQLTGVPAGEYRLVSRADGFAPAVVPLVNIRDGEGLIWPRTITHLPFAVLEVHLDPPLDPSGKRWMVSAAERTPLTATSGPPPRHVAEPDGTWRQEKLRADDYRVTVEDSAGAVLETVTVDLSKSGTTILPVTIHRIAVRGVLRFGDEPLKALIRFSSQSGQSVSATTNDLGQYEAAFPTSGAWSPTIFPNGPKGPRIRAKSITVPDTAQETQPVDIVLGGGRIRGTVSDRHGSTVKAAVHVAREGTLVAQQVTTDDGRFDFIGVDPTDYVVDAEGDEGMAPAQQTHLAKGETAELKLELQPSHRLSAVVLTPTRAPASGAFVRVSEDGGHSWNLLFADVEGRFEYVTSSTSPLAVIVLTYTYPALITQLPPQTDRAVTLMLQPQGGKLRVRRRSWVGRGATLAPMNMFFVPGSPLGLYEGAAYLEPGLYSVCADPPGGACRSVTINPMSDELVDPAEEEKKTP